MANTTPAKYTVQIGPTVTPEVAGELAAWAQVRGVSRGVVARECLEDGLRIKRVEWTERHGPLPRRLLAEHVAAARLRGDKQVRARRDYDDRTRNTERRGPAAAAAGPARILRTESGDVVL